MNCIKKLISLFIVLSMLLMFVGTVSAESQSIPTKGVKVLFSDNFNNGIGNWSDISQRYFIGNTGKLVYKNLTGRNFSNSITNTKYTFTNGHINFDMSAETPTDFSVMVRADGDSAYLVSFDYLSNKINVSKRISRGKTVLIKEADFPFTNKIKYNIDMSFLGTNISIRINGIEYVECSDNGLTSGNIGFTAINGEYSIDNFLIYQIENEDYETPETVEETVKIYVAVDGNDETGDGSYEKPLATVEKAKSFVSRAKGTYLPVEVILKEGEYKRTEAISFTKSDSGTEIAPVTYRAEEGKEVVFNGATKLDISAFKPIDDPEIRSRLYSHIADKVLQMDLKAQGLKKEDIDFVTYGKTKSDGVLKKIKFFLNDRPQTISQWPNAGFQNIEKGTRGSTSSSTPNEGGKIFFTNPEPLRWINAKDAFVEGNMYYEWYTETIPVKEINTKDMSIDLARYSGYGVRENQEYKIINLIEEIDMPGEWYVDFDTMILYYYPEKELSEDDVFEISTMEDVFISLDGVSYINFKDIVFKNNKGPIDKQIGVNAQFKEYGGGIEFGNNTRNIVIDGCTFKDIGGTGIRSLSYKGNSYLWGDMNITIQNNDFYRCSVEGIRPMGGNAITLENANINITNNFFYESEVYGGQSHMCGINIVNNLSVRIFNHAYRTFGNEFRIDNNEIVYGAYGMSDMGAIYVGRDVMMHGSSISRNLIMDYGPAPAEQRSFPCGGIYLDDAASGIELTQNITRARSKNYQSTGVIHGGGADIKYYGNISLNANKGFIVQNRIGSIPSTLGNYNSGALQPAAKRLDENEKGWVKKYPETARMKEWLFDPTLYDSQDYFTENLSTNNDEGTLKTSFDLKPYKTGLIEDAVEINDLSIYVDPENNDYRLKMEAVEKYNLPKTLPNEENLDIDSIGIQREMKYNEKLINFDITYPKNGEIVSFANKVGITWQYSDAANVYEYAVAEDREFNTIVASGETMDNFVELETLEKNKTYYVKVKAINGARIHGYEIENKNGVIEFKTPDIYYRDTSLLELNINELEKFAGTIKDGNGAGEFKKGFKKTVEDLVEESKSKLQEDVKQTDVDAQSEKIINFMTKIDANKNTGYATINLTGNDEWNNSTLLDSINQTETSVELNALYAGATVSLNKELPNTEVVKFKFKTSNLENWQAFGLRNQDASKAIYSDDCYYVIIKKDVFELQKKGTILETAENNGVIDVNKEYEITFGAVTLEGGVNLYLEIDGKVIFDYLDSKDTKDKPGRFVVYIPKETTITVSETDNVPETLFVPSGKIIEASTLGVREVYDTTHNDFAVVNGVYEATSYTQNPDGAEEKANADSSAEVRWKLTATGDTTYEIWYYHHAGAGNDNNVEIIVSGKDGTYRVNADFTSGGEEYKKLGTFKFVSDDASVGVANIVFKGSGNGKVPISSVFIRKAQDGSTDMLKTQK